MSTPSHRIPPVPVRERAACMCEHGDDCTSYAPGHAVHLIQARLAAATPTEWVDAVVESADPGAGILVVRTLADAERIAVWNGGAAAREIAPGDPVALHGRYHVLAAGARRFNVRP